MKLDPCETCGAQSVNLLGEHDARSWLGGHFRFFSGRFRPLCADHLTQAFGHAFRAYGHKVVAFAPLFEESYLPCGYHFTPVNELDRSSRTIVEATLDIVAGHCSACGRSGSVAYAEDDYVDESTIVESLYKGKVQTILCKGCAFDRLAPILVRNCALFAEHIELPYGGDGVYCLKNY